MIPTVDLSAITTIGSGSHKSRDAGMCIMEAVAWLAGEPHSDTPSCACPALAAFARRLNDRYWPGGDEERTRVMKPLIPLLLGSASTTEVYQRRGYFFADRAVRELGPIHVPGPHSDRMGPGVSSERAAWTTLRARRCLQETRTRLVEATAAQGAAVALSSQPAEVCR